MSGGYKQAWRDSERVAFWTAPRVFVGVLLAVIFVYLLLVLITPLTIGFGWARGEANLRSFGATKATYQEAYDDVNALTATAQNVCLAQGAVTEARKAGDENALNQRETQLLVYENSYNSQRGRYDAYMDDHFRGGVNRPKALPRPYPTLAAKLREVCVG